MNNKLALWLTRIPLKSKINSNPSQLLPVIDKLIVLKESSLTKNRRIIEKGKNLFKWLNPFCFLLEINRNILIDITLEFFFLAFYQHLT
jgi:hypothetical protein